MTKKLFRFAVSVNEEVNNRFESIAEQYCTTKSSWILQAALEKLERIEKERLLLNTEK